MIRKLDQINRLVATLLAVVWAVAGLGFLWVGLLQGRWIAVILATFALGYAFLWTKVAVEGRLLNWRDILTPWRR
jgi:uncharacterized membrane protein YjjP (DUF1212 family)